MTRWKVKSNGLCGVILVLGSLVFSFISGPAVAAGSLVTDWDLTPLYSSLGAWEAAKTSLPGMVEQLDRYKGRLDEGPTVMKGMFGSYFSLNKEAYRLSVYANLVSDLDIRKPGPLGRKEELGQMFSEISAQTAWVDPEILSLPSETIHRYLQEEPSLGPYKRYLERLEKQRPHILDTEGEEILGLAGMIQGDGNTIGSILRNAEISWDTITLSDGKELRVDVLGYTRGRAVSEREDRVKTYAAFYGKLAQFQQSLATTLANTVKAHYFNSKIRGYEDTLEASLSGSEVDPEIFNMLIREVNNSLPVLHRYLKLRARMLEIQDLQYTDLYPPLVGKVAGEYPWDKCVKTVLAAFSPLGNEYVEHLRKACEKGWIDVYPAEGKRSGAYVAGSAYEVHPYMLLNHQDDYESASTFAHEAGHLMHSALSNKALPFATAFYATFVAEVASTTQQWLFFRYTLANAQSKEEKLAILGNFLESFRTTVFRQTMFAEFERSMHELVEQGKPITSLSLNAIYLDLIRRYHGQSEGICNVDEKFQVEWAFIPHFHYNYYVYSYATSFIAAAAFHEQILTGENGGVNRYVEKLLKAGGSAPPAEILKAAGVDMTTAAPFRAAMVAMDGIMDEIEEILEN